ncbi:hypothetical protein CPB83DRAFT_783291 [Crepidotus variabilis]|uniref:T-cell immunomodulatory protein TIP C2 domain-containing protein n=1 Tax=Crepidotus variabilis TaxID=179855 RepID=A0A9P6ERN9_9AGAR|nr:hypothetical protein CPB83DRAFT_783291 [Crepidotus variabilis]
MYHRRPGRRRTRMDYLSFLGLLALLPLTHALWPFPQKRFTGNSLLAAGSMGLNGDGRVVALGDFDGDQSLDVLVLDKDQLTISAYYWNHDTFSFVPSEPITHTKKVVNVVPGDFTHSGKLDLLVMSQSQTRGQLDLTLYPSLMAKGFDANNPISITSSSLSQPIMIDIDGDMKIDLLGMTPTSKSSPDEPLQIWKNVWNESTSTSTLFHVEDAPFKGTQCVVSDPHSNAVVDLDGDCLADVFLTCDDGRGGKTYQIWINEKNRGFYLSQEGRLPAGTESISFADVADRDGTIDMVFPSCSRVDSSTGVGSDCYINIAYNEQVGLCSLTTDSGMRKGVRVCRTPGDLCIADTGFKFNLTDSPDNPLFVRFPVSSVFTSSSELLIRDTSFTPPIPVSLKLGDADLDGFPDILAIHIQGRDRTPQLVYSVPCGSGIAGCTKKGSGRRGWKVASKGVEALEKIKDARSLTFLDMDEDGTLDIMVQRTGDQGEGTILFVQNNFYYDAFFLKAIVLNGACDNGWCYNANGTERYHPFGVSYSGATYKYTVLDTAGRRSAAQVGQLPQTSYHSLQTPYSFFGLGRTNNYIENLFVGTTLHIPEHYINMEGVIPNSKVVILPSVVEGDAWKEELFLRPGEWIPWVTVTVVVGMLLLAIIVLVLHLNEKREDELERRKISHHINFAAL